jgi:hypothetical protein
MRSEGVTTTSRHAHRKQIISGRAASQRERILECLRNSAVPLTRRQIAELTRIPINAVCGRVNVLVASGLARVAYEDEDQVTGTRAQFLEAVWPKPAQRRFEWPR